MQNYQADPADYILVGSDYYKLSSYGLSSGESQVRRLLWSKWRLSLDFKLNPLDKDRIERYDGFCNEPMHIGYKRRVGNFYNCYEDIGIEPKEGDWTTTRQFMEHLFGDMVEVIYDWFTILYKYPKQMLPIIILVSKQKQTGKTTFLNYLKEVFKGNTAMLSNDALRSKFNSDWVVKLVITVDEALMSRAEDSERLKALSTSVRGTLESKGKDRYEVNTYLKFVLCSNNPDCPLWIEEDDDRHLVIDVPSIPNKDPNLMAKLKAEIPAFFHFLLHRQMKYPEPQERMWFPMKELETDALKRIKRCSGPKGEIEIAEALFSIMDHYDVDKLEYTLKDMSELLKAFDIRINGSIRDIVRKRWGLEPAPSNMSYTHHNIYLIDPEVGTSGCKGRYFTFTREFVERTIHEKDWKR